MENIGQERFTEDGNSSALMAGDELISELKRAEKSNDPMSLWGAWPGEEPLDELMAALG